jgi:hypothetical protein
MQIRKLISVGLGLGLSYSLCAAAMKNEPADFRGIDWGAPVENHQKDLVALSTNGNLAYYRRPSDQMSWGGAELQKIAYRFFKGRFSGSTLQLFGASNQKAITEKLFELYGTPEQPNKRVPQYVWSGDNAKVVLMCEVTNYCVIDIVSLELIALEENDRRTAASGKDDDKQ